MNKIQTIVLDHNISQSSYVAMLLNAKKKIKNLKKNLKNILKKFKKNLKKNLKNFKKI